MNHGDIDMAPAPPDTFNITRAPGGGWIVSYDGHAEAAFSSASDLAIWLERELGPLDPNHRPAEPLPNVLTEIAQEPPPRRIWHVFAGGKS